MPYGKNWPDRGRPPVYVTFGEPMRAEDGETVAQFSERIAKEVSRPVSTTPTTIGRPTSARGDDRAREG